MAENLDLVLVTLNIVLALLGIARALVALHRDLNDGGRSFKKQDRKALGSSGPTKPKRVTPTFHNGRVRHVLPS